MTSSATTTNNNNNNNRNKFSDSSNKIMPVISLEQFKGELAIDLESNKIKRDLN